MDCLSRCGLDGELMIGAGAIAVIAYPCRFTGVIEDEEGGPAHFIGVVVDIGA